MKNYYKVALYYLRSHLNDLTVRCLMISVLFYFSLDSLMSTVPTSYQTILSILQVLIPILLFRSLVKNRVEKLIKTAEWKTLSVLDEKASKESVLDFMPASPEHFDLGAEENSSKNVIPLKKSEKQGENTY